MNSNDGGQADATSGDQGTERWGHDSCPHHGKSLGSWQTACPHSLGPALMSRAEPTGELSSLSIVLFPTSISSFGVSREDAGKSPWAPC